MPSRCHRLAALITRPCFAHISLSRLSFHLSASCLRLNLPVLFMTRLCRDIFCRHRGHVILDLLRLCCRYLCLMIGVRALTSLVYLHLFLMSCLVEFYLYLVFFFSPSLPSPYLPSSLSYHLASPCSFFLPRLLPPPPRYGHCFTFGFRLGLVFSLSPFLLSQAETSVNALFLSVPFFSVVLCFVKSSGSGGSGWGSPFVCISRCIGLPPFLPLFFLSALFQRTALASKHFPETDRALSPFLSPGCYCPAGSSAVTPCPAGAINWLL
jgi:hypothetical protein